MDYEEDSHLADLICKDMVLKNIWDIVILDIKELLTLGYSQSYYFKNDGWGVTHWVANNRDILKRHYPHAVCS